jgi:hypothetical protein
VNAKQQKSDMPNVPVWNWINARVRARWDWEENNNVFKINFTYALEYHSWRRRGTLNRWRWYVYLSVTYHDDDKNNKITFSSSSYFLLTTNEMSFDSATWFEWNPIDCWFYFKDLYFIQSNYYKLKFIEFQTTIRLS